jgi:hypothetical protein
VLLRALLTFKSQYSYECAETDEIDGCVLKEVVKSLCDDVSNSAGTICRVQSSIRCTPAMETGITGTMYG